MTTTTSPRRFLVLRPRRRRDEEGFALAVGAAFVAAVLVALLAIAVDTGFWYVTREDAQRAADAAALAGVPYLPQDLDAARTRALEVAAQNGFCGTQLPASACPQGAQAAEVSVSTTDRSTELKVTIVATRANQFGQVIGVDRTRIGQTAVADYQGPAPMGSPCNTFGNEPGAGAGSSSPQPRSGSTVAASSARATGLSNCDTSAPQFWAGIQGVDTNKQNGDRYMNRYCDAVTLVDVCAAPSRSAEYDPSTGRGGKHGHFWVVRVAPEYIPSTGSAKPISLQLYDPAFVNSGDYTCSGLAPASSFDNNMNDYVTTDGKNRYSSSSTSLSATQAPYCNGDARAGGRAPSSSMGFTTSFALRTPTETKNPLKGSVMSSAGCVKQYRPFDLAGYSDANQKRILKKGDSAYNDQVAQGFHNWTQMCQFTPTVAGDYYLQVRTNVAFVTSKQKANTSGWSSLVSDGDATVWSAQPNSETGDGNNTFGIRAVPVGGSNTDRQRLSVAGYERMPIFVNSSNQATTPTSFNLIRVPSGSAGRYITFFFFDAADTDGDEGTVQIRLPNDTEIPAEVRSDPWPKDGCRSSGGNAGAGLSSKSCLFAVTNQKNNGRVQRIDIPIHSKYRCNDASSSGCWFKVEVKLKGQVRDFTTWNATIEGDPVRLID